MSTHSGLSTELLGRILPKRTIEDLRSRSYHGDKEGLKKKGLHDGVIIAESGMEQVMSRQMDDWEEVKDNSLGVRGNIYTSGRRV